MSNVFGAMDGIVSMGTVGAVPTGPRGVGIRSISYTSGNLRVVMTDDRVAMVPMPIGGGMGDGATGDPSTSIPLTQEVIDYVAAQLAPILATDTAQDTAIASIDTSLTAMKADDASAKTRLTALETADKTQTSRLDAISASVQNVIDTGATDAELAKAIADLSLADYLKATDAASLYASKAHNHPISDVTGLQAKLDEMDAAITAASGVDMSSYLTRADASNTYAAKTHTHAIADVTDLQAALDAKFTKPATGTTGHVLTWNGSALVLQAVSATGDLTKAQADTYYAAKTHNHAIADVTGLQAALDGKMASFAGSTSGQVMTWDGTKWTAAAPSTPATPAVTERFGMGGTLAVKSGGGRAYNLSGSARTLAQLHASVGTAPTGSGVTVALVVDGTQVGTATIAAGANTATATLSASWPAGSYLGVNVTAVGSMMPGSDLVVAVRTAG